MNNVLDFAAKTIDGRDVKLAEYKGHPLLIVNVASKCGLTPQYEGLEKLHDEFAAKGLRVIGFPANEFGAQEPGSNDEIKTFCTSNYGVKFDMMQKVVVKGDGIDPLFEYLTKKIRNSPATSNGTSTSSSSTRPARSSRDSSRKSSRRAPRCARPSKKFCDRAASNRARFDHDQRRARAQPQERYDASSEERARRVHGTEWQRKIFARVRHALRGRSASLRRELSSYARQFLGQMDKPKYDAIRGLSPTIAIEQKSASNNPRSTVGTATEVYDFLRVMFARAGVQHCHVCGKRVGAQTAEQIVDALMEHAEGTKCIFARAARAHAERRAPRRHGRRATTRLRAHAHRRQDDRLDGRHAAPRQKSKHDIDIVVDRLVIENPNARASRTRSKRR